MSQHATNVTILALRSNRGVIGVLSQASDGY